MRKFKNILVTGGCGFIGSNFIRYLFNDVGFEGNIINVDLLTYAGNPANLEDFHGVQARYFFEQQDICNQQQMTALFEKHAIDCVIHFAAESHVDRSILGPGEFVRTNINGTFSLLEAARTVWKQRSDVLFHHVSTDEVYGSLGETGFFHETTAYDPRSPYSASKAASDHLVRAYSHTYQLPVTISNCSNNYGAYQFPEKLIPIMILNMLNKKPLPVYGEGANIRDWLYVHDHSTALWAIVSQGTIGDTYNIGGENEWRNIDLVNFLCETLAKKQGCSDSIYKDLITYVKDRPGHDMRYAINCDKIKSELGWKQSVDFAAGLSETVDWYLNNSDWIENIQSGDYKKWIENNYNERLNEKSNA